MQIPFLFSKKDLEVSKLAAPSMPVYLDDDRIVACNGYAMVVRKLQKHAKTEAFPLVQGESPANLQMLGSLALDPVGLKDAIKVPFSGSNLAVEEMQYACLMGAGQEKVAFVGTDGVTVRKVKVEKVDKTPNYHKPLMELDLNGDFRKVRVNPKYLYDLLAQFKHLDFVDIKVRTDRDALEVVSAGGSIRGILMPSSYES